MFRLPKSALTASEFQKQGGEWEPYCHFTGSHGNNLEIEVIQTVISDHCEHLVAYYFYNPMPGMYSLELQWANTTDGKQEAINCRTAYGKLFTPMGKLKKKHAE